MSKIKLSPDAKNDFKNMDNSLQIIFAKHVKKMEVLLPRKFIYKQGILFKVENVGQGRIAGLEEEGNFLVVRMFKTHKEYEQWLRGI